MTIRCKSCIWFERTIRGWKCRYYNEPKEPMDYADKCPFYRNYIEEYRRMEYIHYV